jgi:histone-lysine N-methyltransferase SETD8
MFGPILGLSKKNSTAPTSTSTQKVIMGLGQHHSNVQNTAANTNHQSSTNSSTPPAKTKITDFFQPTRRSQRKTDQALKAERLQSLVNAIVDGAQDGLKCKEIPGKGRGIISTRHFLRNEFVVEYWGELLDINTAKKREKKYAQDLRVGCYMYYFTYRNQQYCVDATAETDRLGRLINHSRNGNLVPKVLEVNNVPRLILVAKRDIDANEELCYDYGDRSKSALLHHPWLAN